MRDVAREDTRIEHVGQRNFTRVSAGECRRQSRVHSFAKLTEPLGTNALEKRSEQPTSQVPGEPEVSSQDCRAGIETSVDEHLLANCRSIPGVLRVRYGGSRLHGA